MKGQGEGLITAVKIILAQRQDLLMDVALRGLYVDVRLDERGDGTVRVILVTPSLRKDGRKLSRTSPLDMLVVSALEQRRALLDDRELKRVAVEARIDHNGSAHVNVFPTYARERARVLTHD